jgi:hypothetical protein
MTTVTNTPFDHILDIARQLHALQERVALLDRERATLQEEIALRVGELSTAAVGIIAPASPASPPPPPAPPLPSFPDTFAGNILTVMHRSPGHPFSARDLVAQLGIGDRRSRDNLRTTLSRMAKDGRIVRTRYGRYAVAAS